MICQKVDVFICFVRAPSAILSYLCLNIKQISHLQYNKSQVKAGMPPKRKTQRRRQRRNPPDPGPKVCSPLMAKTRQSKSCLPSHVLQKISIKTRKKYGGSSNTNILKKQLALDLGCSTNDEKCIIEKSALSYKEKKALLNTFFRPPMPDEWKRDPDMWLNSDDITKVMKQYEQAYPEFKFLGVVPIDFSAPDPYTETERKCMNDQFCHVDLKEEVANGRRILGAVFNLDPHYKDGSHWVALAIDLKRLCVYYFDSYGMPPPPQVARFMRYLTLQNPGLRLQSNGRRFQYGDSECGMYSLYFIIRMIAGESFKKFCKMPIADKYMLSFRKILFDANAHKVLPVNDK